MTTTNTPEPRRHHYVPRFYLERFTDQKGRLGAFDRQRGSSITTSPGAVAVERDFYRLPENTVLPVNLLEEALSAEEAGAALAIQDIVATGVVSPLNRELLVLHIALQMLRTRRQRNSIGAMATWLATNLAQVNLNRRLEAGEFEKESEHALAESALQQLVDGQIRVTLNEQALLGVSLREADRIGEALRTGWNWIVVVLTTPKFITSDHPICLLGEPEPGSPSSNVGVQSALEIWFPLDPRHALVLSRDHSVGSPLLNLSNGHVRTINMRLALESERWSFFRPGSWNMNASQIPPAAPKFEESTISSQNRSDGTVSELVRVGMERPHVPNERLLSERQLRPFARRS